MDTITAIWLGFTIATPVATFPSIAILRLFHTRKSQWRPLDILVVALVVAQLFATLLTFGFSTVYLLHQAGLLRGLLPGYIENPFCATLVCGWSAAHTLHAATLSSIAVDRALMVRWPYKYRLSIRRTQVRYHVAVLAIVSILVGVAALFAGTNHKPEQHVLLNDTAAEPCLFLPHMFDTRFAMLWICLHGALFLVTLVAGVAVAVTYISSRCSGSSGVGSGSDLRTLGTTSDASATSGTLLTQHSRYADISTPQAKPPFADAVITGRDSSRCLTVATLLLISYLTYHLPLLVLTSMGIFFRTLLPDWPFPALALGLGLLQSLLVLLSLVTIDPVFHNWMLESLRPRSTSTEGISTSMDHRSARNFHCQESSMDQSFSSFKTGSQSSLHLGFHFQDPAEVKFPLTNGSLVAHLMNAALASDNRGRKALRYGVSSLPTPEKEEGPPSLTTFQLGTRARPVLEPLYSDPLINRDPHISETFTTRAQINEPIYASLSETLGSMRPSFAGTDPEESATESAGEDFEFHDTRFDAEKSKIDKTNPASLGNLNKITTNHVVSLEALHKALKRSSSTSYLDNGSIDTCNAEEKTVFVSDYL